MIGVGNDEEGVGLGEVRKMVEEHVYESTKLKELGWSRTATRIRPLKGWFGLAHRSKVLTNKVDVEGSQRVLEEVRQAQVSSSAEE
jgi:hypothetical protein